MYPERILVTGAFGFMGKACIAAIRRKWPQVVLVGLDRHVPEKELFVDRFVSIDLSTQSSTELTTLFNQIRPDVIINLASVIKIGSDQALFAQNVQIGFSLYSALLSYGKSVPGMVLLQVGTAAEYGLRSVYELITENDFLCPADLYGRSKMIQSLLMQELHRNSCLDIRIVRPFNAMGVAMSDKLFFPTAIRRVLAAPDEEPFEVYGLSDVRDYIADEDVAAGILQVIQFGVSGEVYNLASGRGVTGREVIECMFRLAGHETPPLVEIKKDNPTFSVANVSKINKLGFEAKITHEQVIRSMMEQNRKST
ncbi:MAG: NAD-dependent epimerase/dehydratase family protein [Chlorobium sp.]|nr:MAG: NAD-dependent epimerase/dehydratase family protein [Chlorobium sp.]